MCEGTCRCLNVENARPGEPEAKPAASRYGGLPVAFIAGEPGEPPTPAPFLLSRDEVIRFLRLNDSRTRFPAKAIQRYRGMGLRTVRVGRCVWYRLDDVLRFLDAQQTRVSGQTDPREKDR